MKKLITVYGMISDECRRTITHALTTTEGVSRVYIKMPTRIVEVEFDHKVVTLETIKKTITELGYDPM